MARSRRFLRFSLRTFFIALTILSISLGWLGYRVNLANKQQRSVDALQEVGIALSFDYGRESPYPVWLQTLLGKFVLHDVVGVCIATEHGWRSGDITLDDVSKLKVFSKIRYLTIVASLTDEAVQELKSFKCLKRVQIELLLNSDEIVAEIDEFPGVDAFGI